MKIKKIFLTLVMVAIVLAGGLIFHYHKNQEEIIFRTVPLDETHVFELEHPYQEIFLQTPDETRINGLWFHQTGAKGVVLFFHGRGKNLDFWAHRAYPFIQKGYDVFIIDYRGFGKSSKGVTESSLLEDGDVAYDFLLAHYPEDKIVVYGHSMGTSIATWVASTHNPQMLILEAPYTNMIEAAAFTKPFVPEWLIKWILKYHLRNDLWITRVKCPIYIFHGKLDTTVPYNHSQKLYSSIKDNRQNEMITLPNAGHGNISHDPIYSKKLNEILP